MASGYHFVFTRFERAASVFAEALWRIGWALAQLVLALRGFVDFLADSARWALTGGYPYPPGLAGLAANERAQAPVLARLRAYRMRRLERAACRDMSAGVGLRLAV